MCLYLKIVAKTVKVETVYNRVKKKMWDEKLNQKIASQ